MMKSKFNKGDKVMIIKPSDSRIIATVDRIIEWSASMNKYDREITIVTQLNKDGTVKLKGFDNFIFHTSWLHMVKKQAKEPETIREPANIDGNDNNDRYEKYAMAFSAEILKLLKDRSFRDMFMLFCNENDITITQGIAKMSVDLVRKVFKEQKNAIRPK